MCRPILPFLLLTLLLSCERPQQVVVTEVPKASAESLVVTSFPKPPEKVRIPSGSATVRECEARPRPRPRPSREDARSMRRREDAPGSGDYGKDEDRERDVVTREVLARRSSSRASLEAPPVVASQSRLAIHEEASAMPRGASASPSMDDGALAVASERPKTEKATSTELFAPMEPEMAQDAPTTLSERAAPDRADDQDDNEVAGAMATQPSSEPTRSTAEWGGTVYLSNDDSMSLASAQRMLYALQKDVRFESQQIRPHELLNYFSFDTEAVAEGRMFSVLASAEQTGSDTLSLALAVRGVTAPRLPLDLTLLVDRSGSMAADGKMEYVKRGLHLIDSNLRDGDRVDLVLFDNTVCTPLEDFVVGRDQRKLLSDAIDSMKPHRRTNLDAGLKEAYRLARSHVAADAAWQESRNHRVMLLTDAILNTGSVDVDIVSEIGSALDADGIRLTGVGVGRDFNDTMLDKLTEKGKGAYLYVGSESVVDRLFGVGFESLIRTIANDVRFTLHLPQSLGMERFYGEESSRRAEDVLPVNYYSGTSQLFLQDLKIRPDWMKPEDEIALTISYIDATTGKASEQGFRSTIGALLDGDKHNLRKARALMAWTDVLMARTLGSDPCGAPLSEFRSRSSGLHDDAELLFVDSLVARKCEVAPASPASEVAEGVPFKVRVDADIPIAEVAVQCQSRRSSESLGGGQSVASFSVLPGPCLLTLKGVTDMQTRVVVPRTGSTVRCMVRGGRMSCG